MNDNTKFVLPLAVIDYMGEVEGKTRMQKIICLIQIQINKNPKKTEYLYDYHLYHHGPFSDELTSVLEELISSGMIEIRANSMNDGTYLYVYKLTVIGKKYLKELTSKNNLSPEVQKIISEVCDQVRNYELQDLIHYTYREFGAIPKRKIICSTYQY